MPRTYSACLARVSGSKPPTTFLDELVEWAIGLLRKEPPPRRTLSRSAWPARLR